MAILVGMAERSIAVACKAIGSRPRRFESYFRQYFLIFKIFHKILFLFHILINRLHSSMVEHSPFKRMVVGSNPTVANLIYNFLSLTIQF